jgi:CheY-like chemotaxis protein
MTTNTVTFLLVEDDEIDIKVIKRGFKALKLANPIRIARDGIEALEILRGTNGQEQITAPYLILLDINMPRMNGIEFLQAIRADDDLKSSIVFMLTTSASEEDRTEAYNFNVAGYLLKSKVMDSFANALTMLDNYWKVVEFPKE